MFMYSLAIGLASLINGWTCRLPIDWRTNWLITDGQNDYFNRLTDNW